MTITHLKMNIMEELKLNPNYKLNVIEIPGENDSVIVIDNFLLNHDSVIDFAKNNAYFQPVGADGTLYPGKRDDMPATYFRVLTSLLEDLLEKELLTKTEKAIYIHKCKLSLTTLKPWELSPLQRIPHIDSSDDKTYASVHYLIGSEYGGTCIYRFKPLNFIRITKANKHEANQMMQAIEKYADKHQGYLTKDTNLFEQVIKVEAKVNRIVFYKSNLLHCANLTSSRSYSSDKNNGRLTIASFFRID